MTSPYRMEVTRRTTPKAKAALALEELVRSRLGDESIEMPCLEELTLREIDLLVCAITGTARK